MKTSATVVDEYDRKMYDRYYAELFENTDFANYGYWDATTRGMRQACENLMEVLLRYIPSRDGAILDVACGKGETTNYLTRYYPPARITAVNVSDRQLETARAKVPGATFLTMDAARLSFPDASFDGVICVEAAFHFLTREEFLKQALRVLKPGGRLALSDILMTPEAERRRPFRHEANYLPDPAAYESLLRRVGFADVSVVDATEPCWRGSFRHVVRFVHDLFLAGKINFADLQRYLDASYSKVPELTFYLLAGARKP